jgi:tRNA threonylcarbamoyladenosine biosynthesis protein TsaB
MAQPKRIDNLGRSGEARHDNRATKDSNGSREPLILAVETSSRIGSVALALGSELLSERFFSGPLQHSMEVFPSIIQLLDQFGCRPHDIRQIHLDTGPGSFTGLRIAVTIAKAMSLAGGVQIVTVDTLDTIAANVAGPTETLSANDRGWSVPIERLAVVLDAKRGQFFTAVYDRVDASVARTSGNPGDDPGYKIPATNYGLWRKILPDCLMDAQQLVRRFAASERPIYLTGDGLLYHRDAFAAEHVHILDDSLWSPRAAKVYALAYRKAQAGRFADPLAVAPFYLRGPDVTLKHA